MIYSFNRYNTLVSILFLTISFGRDNSFISGSPGDQNTVRPLPQRGDTIIPDRWLRTFDPITIFFDSSTGPGSLNGIEP